ncbi:MAG: orotidine-5'-phosphate decarboxylase [Acidobacteriales bacterium]|nr:orotidine-5'-phosphate decarboxylase [Terriglobales bacterium]
MSSPSEKLIVAVDVPSAAAAQALISQLGDAAGFYKIGLELFTAEGPSLVRDVVAGGRSVFLDLKFHDIPNTVAAAVRSAARLGVSMITIHSGGGAAMVRAACDAAKTESADLLVLGVTVLTSTREDELTSVGVQGSLSDQVVRLAKLAVASGCGGLVCSPHEAARLRAEFGEEIVLVTPGVRPEGTSPGDQARTATPAQAIRAGANHIVVGRPITAAPDPAAAARAILQELSALSCD